jgi:hypothetical protein
MYLERGASTRRVFDTLQSRCGDGRRKPTSIITKPMNGGRAEAMTLSLLSGVDGARPSPTRDNTSKGERQERIELWTPD